MSAIKATCQQLLIDSQDSSNCTPLLYCIQNANINCIKSLIAKGADVDIECDSYFCFSMFSKTLVRRGVDRGC